MQKIIHSLYNFSFYTLKLIGLALSFFLFISAMMFSSTDTDITTLRTFIYSDNLISETFFLILCIGILFLLRIPCKRKPILTSRIALIVTLLSYAITGTLLILCTKSMPHLDSLFVYNISGNCALNNYTDINPDSYLSIYPHQIGLVFFYEPLLRLWNLLKTGVDGYIFLQFVNLCLTLIMLYFLFKIVQKVFKNTYTTVCCMFMLLCCFPLYFYILRVYGDIPSLAFFVVGLWALIKILSEKSKNKFLLSLLSIVCFTLSVTTRKNSIIILIALIIITLLIALYKKRVFLLLLPVCYLLIAIFTLPAIESIYEYKADNYLDFGTPPIAYIAMGMQYAPKANGWYNGYNYNVYVESGHNMQFINTYSKKQIEKRFTFFKENPSDAFNFYFEKYASQWCDGTYASRELTAATTSQRSDVFEHFYSKDGGTVYIFLCNIYQNLLYFGTFLFCLGNFFKKGKKDILPYISILIAFGGFLFHFLWEANSRAIFPYTFLLLPISAAGIGTVIFINPRQILHKFYKKIIHNIFHFFKNSISIIFKDIVK